MTPQERAARVADVMFENDQASQWLGLRIESAGPGTAVLSMRVEDRHLNGFGICHGGFIFTLADSAFAFACNSANRVTVAQENQITFLSPGQPGETLTATAVETAAQGRSGVYDVTVTGGDGRKVALMRGLSRTIQGQHFEEQTRACSDAAAKKENDNA
ncbi:hydroxyphenylacetyl-CoA thioesterase PaaI [Aestuariicoccus sp. MJ-SS9]|uniref:hydroxyphenylacetyl-CoA thioesterase PaaI n=1 Tax=Aestuariicoccus sp. MJ-SS9 TaxID=3079855 RepID=UPI002914A67D|nr:hydroxyphenylacetyl-CoA thioesterase PaaI [Aestuariicoccus sp. MJ-SS9]MDU8910108.1 hydroxyphenylacetyl-CoA thioesterase PaaI [Aestuariicoccus sp. MJ-SS9]